MSEPINPLSPEPRFFILISTSLQTSNKEEFYRRGHKRHVKQAGNCVLTYYQTEEIHIWLALLVQSTVPHFDGLVVSIA